jgi:hypothetical protein
MKTVHIGIATAADVKARAASRARVAAGAHQLCLAGFDAPGVDAESL